MIDAVPTGRAKEGERMFARNEVHRQVRRHCSQRLVTMLTRCILSCLVGAVVHTSATASCQEVGLIDIDLSWLGPLDAQILAAATSKPEDYGRYLCEECTDIGSIGSGAESLGEVFIFLRSTQITKQWKPGDKITICNGSQCVDLEWKTTVWLPIKGPYPDPGDDYKNKEKEPDANVPEPPAGGGGGMLAAGPSESPFPEGFEPFPEGIVTIEQIEPPVPEGTVTIEPIDLPPGEDPFDPYDYYDDYGYLEGCSLTGAGRTNHPGVWWMVGVAFVFFRCLWRRRAAAAK